MNSRKSITISISYRNNDLNIKISNAGDNLQERGECLQKKGWKSEKTNTLSMALEFEILINQLNRQLYFNTGSKWLMAANVTEATVSLKSCLCRIERNSNEERENPPKNLKSLSYRVVAEIL